MSEAEVGPAFPNKTLTEIYEEYEAYRAIKDHVSNARGVADTSIHTREMVPKIDKLVKEVDAKLKPLEKALDAARVRARRA